MIIATHDPRPLVEDTPRVDARAFRDRLRAFPGAVAAWRVGPVTFGGRIYLEPDGDEAGAIVAIFPGGHELARFVVEPARLGGSMVRAECPRCRARGVRYLYVRGRALACRACHGLAWASQRQSPFARSHLSTRRLRAALGLEERSSEPGDGPFAFVSEKPIGMHYPRFGRMSARLLHSIDVEARTFEERLARRRTRYVPGGYRHRDAVERVIPDPAPGRSLVEK